MDLQSFKREGPLNLYGRRCAIYARKFTYEHDKLDENKSTTRQIEHARKFIEQKSWTLADDHIHSDDGISGAEFQNRPHFQALISALKPKQFSVFASGAMGSGLVLASQRRIC